MIAIYAFNENISQTWPIESYTTKWFGVAWHNPDVRDALKLSVEAALGATAIALVLGTLAALAVSRSTFFGRETISFLVILPIALPGIITGLALQATILNVLEPIGISFSIWTIIIGHATFCIVVVYNNAVARARRIGGPLQEASMDLGADTWQTFRYVTFPQLRYCAPRRRAARVRALVRRGRRHDLHVGCAADAPDLDLHELRAPARASDRERRRALRHRRLDHPGLDRAANRRRRARRRTRPARARWRAAIETQV